MSSSGEVVPTVWLVWCYDDNYSPGDAAYDVTHVFSTKQKAQEFCAQDSGRGHVISYRVVDCPAQTEGQAT